MEVIVERSPKFEILYDLPPDTDTVVLMGGRGGQKTYEMSKYCAYSATIKLKRTVILRDEKALIKESILNEIWERYKTANVDGYLDQHFTKNETELKHKGTDTTVIYTKGFRASNLGKKANLKGPSDIDIAVVEEAEDTRDKTKYDTFVDGLRKDGCVVFIVLNTPDINHWVVKRYFNLEYVEDGYFRCVPKTNIPGFICIQSSFEDNPYLPAHIVARYRGYGDPKHHLFDKHHYFTAILGLASTGRKGQVFTKVKPISLAAYRALQHREIFGQDFGTAAPAALVGAKFDKNNVYFRLINYLPMDVKSLGELYCKLQFGPADRIVCDYAEPETISKLKKGWKELSQKDYEIYPAMRNGFNVHNCVPKNVKAHVGLMQGANIFIVEECEEAWTEVAMYCYAENKDGDFTNEPEDKHNHFWDAARYVYMDQRGKQIQGSQKIY